MKIAPEPLPVRLLLLLAGMAVLNFAIAAFNLWEGSRTALLRDAWPALAGFNTLVGCVLVGFFVWDLRRRIRYRRAQEEP